MKYFGYSMEYVKILYTETHSKLGIVARRRLGVKSGLPVPKQLNSNELSDAGRLKSNGCRRSQNPSFECVSVYKPL